MVGDYVAALIILIVASLTDLLDGYLARRLGQVTRLGQLLDPAADRLYIFAALIGLAANELVPWWIVVVIVARDVFLLVLGVVLANHGYGPLPVHQLGKVATFALFFGLPVIMLGLAFPAVEPVSEPVGWAITRLGRLPVLVGGHHLRDRDGPRHPHSPCGGRAPIGYAGTGRLAVADTDISQAGGAGEADGTSPETSANNIVGDGTADTTIGFSREAAAQLTAVDADITAEEQEAIAALPSGSALLIVRRGPNSGARFLLDTDVTTVGRHPDADIFLDDVTVSRRHAEFLRHARPSR